MLQALSNINNKPQMYRIITFFGELYRQIEAFSKILKVEQYNLSVY